MTPSLQERYKPFQPYLGSGARPRDLEKMKKRFPLRYPLLSKVEATAKKEQKVWYKGDSPSQFCYMSNIKCICNSISKREPYF